MQTRHPPPAGGSSVPKARPVRVACSASVSHAGTLYMAYMTLYAFIWLKCLYMDYNSYMPLYGLKPLRVISHIEAL